MAPKITINVDNKGNVKSDFSGFEDDSCHQYEQRLRSLLQSYGVSTTCQVQKKSPQQRIAESTGDNTTQIPMGAKGWNKTKV